MSMYTSPIIRVVAGPQERVIYAHQEILGRSKFFNACLQPQNFNEGVEKVVSLPEDNPDAIKIVLAFLYEGRFSFPKELGGDFTREGFIHQPPQCSSTSI